MPEIVKGVSFDTIAREWRFKWSPENEKKSLEEAQQLLEEVLPEVKSVDGVVDIRRTVCGGCLDFKVSTVLPAEKFGEWEKKGFAPEQVFLDKASKISGISQIETQTYTIASMM
ncbi:hypothetical protein FVE85_1811 [Porphyridium purpureum]|uniref:Uncharacterized protein n=1 Tax=Porphyridium purpureum TaxID=35688 RepID=A0A5J4YWF3_PORPP|nr:hypothetical protein FVE85_1811 [Porphyridium purpureum]|eukprot:POR0105..scf209_3